MSLEIQVYYTGLGTEQKYRGHHTITPEALLTSEELASFPPEKMFLVMFSRYLQRDMRGVLSPEEQARCIKAVFNVWSEYRSHRTSSPLQRISFSVDHGMLTRNGYRMVVRRMCDAGYPKTKIRKALNELLEDLEYAKQGELLAEINQSENAEGVHQASSNARPNSFRMYYP